MYTRVYECRVRKNHNTGTKRRKNHTNFMTLFGSILILALFVTTSISIGFALIAAGEHETSTLTTVGTNLSTETTPLDENDVQTTEPVVDNEDPVIEIPEEPFDFTTCFGNETIDVDGSVLTMYDLPNVYYPDINFSYFQPYMDYRMVNNPKAQAYQVVHSENTYVDENGMFRYATTEDQFTIDGKDDYVIALGTFYKEKGTCGSRYLIVTSTGMYTAITGDEKDDRHTDEHNMFSMHGEYAGVIEWLVDTSKLDNVAKRRGTVTAGPIEELKGEILYIYRID